MVAERRSYDPPAVVYEASLEVQAGSVLSGMAVVDPARALFDPASPPEIR
jgi:hypothetical protein